jgi:hypothetical protein
MGETRHVSIVEPTAQEGSEAASPVSPEAWEDEGMDVDADIDADEDDDHDDGADLHPASLRV